MFHTPNLTGLKKKWIPRRINEGWGLQHMKLYGIDDEIILSGYGVFVPSGPRSLVPFFWIPLKEYHITNESHVAPISPMTTSRIDSIDIMYSVPRS